MGMIAFLVALKFKNIYPLKFAGFLFVFLSSMSTLFVCFSLFCILICCHFHARLRSTLLVAFSVRDRLLTSVYDVHGRHNLTSKIDHHTKRLK